MWRNPSQLDDLTDKSEASLADDFDQHPLSSSPVELAVEDLLPRAEVNSPPVIATTTSRPITYR